MAYQEFHSGIPITRVLLDATNTIPITEKFFEEFSKEAGYIRGAVLLQLSENGERYQFR